jgi:S1-C subfamily serine protease
MKWSWRAWFLPGLLLGVVAGVLVSVSLIRALGPSPAAERAAAERAVSSRGALQDDEQATIAVFRTTSPSVAFITTASRRVDFWTRNVFEVPRGTGSGFVWDERGHIVTNFHVVQSASSADVTLGEDSYDATLVGEAPDHDLAVLRISAPRDKLVPLKIGTSRDLQVGQTVYAIGNPFGLDYTLTTGIVSALGRRIQSVTQRPIDGVIQTDAAINPGNSGGPLLDSSGRLIGVTTAIYSPSGASAGIGFAVPVDRVNRIVPQLISYGRASRAVLGVGLDDRLSALVTRRLGVEGVLLVEVYEGTGAAAAGLRETRLSRGSVDPGDIVQEVDGRKVRTQDDLLAPLGDHRPGDTVTLTILRDGKTLKVPVKLSAAED